MSDDLAISLTLLRAIRRVSQNELADLAGVTNSAVSDYERGKVDPQSQTLGKLLHALRLPLCALDHSADFIRLIRAVGLGEAMGESPAAPAELALVSAKSRELRKEIAQVAMEGGRLAGRLLHLLLLIFAGRDDT